MLVQKIIVPAFFPLNEDWRKIERAERAVRIVVPEFSFSQFDPETNPNAVRAAREQFARCRNNGQKILGYVRTICGHRDQNEVNNDIQSWFRLYQEQLDGIFFDEGLELDDKKREYFTTLLRNFKDSHPDRNIVLLNAPQYPNEWVMEVADYLILWEEDINAYRNQYYALVLAGEDRETTACGQRPSRGNGIPDWWRNPQYSERIFHNVHGCRTREEMSEVIRLSKERNAGNIYVFDGDSTAYNRLPSYWQELIEAARGRTREPVM